MEGFFYALFFVIDNLFVLTNCFSVACVESYFLWYADWYRG